MVPIRQEEVAKVHIVVARSRPIDDDAAEDAIPGLDIEVGMIPSCSILHRSPLVRVRVTRGNWALRKTWNTIHLVGPVLADAVKVKTGSIRLQRVCQMHDCEIHVR